MPVPVHDDPHTGVDGGTASTSSRTRTRSRSHATSAPVSPSASFANLEALRNSLAMRSGNLDLDESAHTFPIDDERAAPTRKPRSNSARSMHSPSTSTSPPLPPPLSLRNLPRPRPAHSPHFDRTRGMSFTPATTPPATGPSSPNLAAASSFMPLYTQQHTGRRRSASGTSIASGEGSGNAIGISTGRRRTRSRATSEVDEMTSAAIEAPPRRPRASQDRHHRRTSSGIQLALASSRSRDDPANSDTGAEGDDDESARPGSSRIQQDHSRPLRARSSPHLPIDAFPAAFPEEQTGYHRLTPGRFTPLSSSRAHSPHALSRSWSSQQQHNGYPFPFAASPVGSPDEAAHQLSAQLWQFRQAAVSLGLSPSGLDGLGVAEPHTSFSPAAAHADEDDPHLAELLLPPPPPYQASEDSDEARRARERDSINLLELEQAQASLGRRLQSLSESHTPQEHAVAADLDEGLAFRARRTSRGRRSASEQTAGSNGVPASLRREGEVLTPRSTSANHDSTPASPPAWQPKSDTEAEAETDAEARQGALDENRETLGELRSLPSSMSRNNRLSSAGTSSRSRTRNASMDRAGPRPLAASSPLVQQIAVEEEEDLGPPPWLLRLLMHPLRLLAAVPGSVGTFWLIRNAYTHYHLSGGSLVKRGPLDPTQPELSNPFRMTCGMDFLLASLWACSTAYHALSLTTLLLRRWLVYYTLLPSLIRLIALQAICWPLVRLTIFAAGPDRPVEAWIAIASFTAFSDVVARWVTSNIADAPSERHRRDQPVRGAGSSGGGSTPTPATMARQATNNGGSLTPRPRGKLRAGQRFWRAVMGAPFDSSTSESESEGEGADDSGARVISTSALEGIGRSGMTHILTQRIRSLRAAARAARGDETQDGHPSPTLEHSDVLSGLETDYDGETSDAGLTSGGGGGRTFDDEEEEDSLTRADVEHRLRLALRRKKRRHRMRLKMAAISGLDESGDSRRSSTRRSSGSGLFSLFSKKATDDTMLLTSGELKVRIRSRRIFHWKVAMKRNVAPIGVLAYLTLWGLLLCG